MKAIWLPVGLLTLLLLVWLLPVADYLQAALAWIQANPSISWLVYALLYMVATVLMLPGSILTLGAGFLFGLVYGYMLVAEASVIGATLAFLIGRFLARDWVEGKLATMPKIGQ